MATEAQSAIILAFAGSQLEALFKVACFLLGRREELQEYLQLLATVRNILGILQIKLLRSTLTQTLTGQILSIWPKMV